MIDKIKILPIKDLWEELMKIKDLKIGNIYNKSINVPLVFVALHCNGLQQQGLP